MVGGVIDAKVIPACLTIPAILIALSSNMTAVVIGSNLLDPSEASAFEIPMDGDYSGGEKE
jgi:hypothetical protein